MNDELIEAVVGEDVKMLNGEPWYPDGCTKLGSAGFVKLTDVMGNEDDIAIAARTSYSTGTKKVSDNIGLIRRLLRDRHTTPFEMVELKFLMMCPMDTWRQWIRHRTASVNEYSTRYSVAIDDKLVTDPGKWRTQSVVNKQGSDDYLVDWPENVLVERISASGLIINNTGQSSWDDRLRISIEDVKTKAIRQFVLPASGFGPGIPDVGTFLSVVEHDFHKSSDKLYNLRLALGVAKEQARKDLPLSTYTRAYWKIDLHNFLHFCGLRMESHAQLEIREYANAMFEQVRVHFPNVCKAFEQYRLNALTLTELDQIVVSNIAMGIIQCKEHLVDNLANVFDNKQEMKECLTKLNRLKMQTWGLVL